jgi:hypothetical protein
MYYVMTCEGMYPARPIRKSPFFMRGPWFTGQPITYNVPQPLEYELDPDYEGDLKPFYREAAPIMRQDLLEALHAGGVDNLQLFDAVVTDPTTGQSFTNYKAVNVIGAVSAADMAQSTRMGAGDSTMVDVDFDSLVIDEARPRGTLLFRLAESVGAIVVHDRVKQVIEARAIPGMTFYASGEWSG